MSSVHPQMVDPSQSSCIGELLEESLLTFKSETALIEVDRKRERSRLRYLDFRREAARVIAHLHASEIGPGSRVAILMSNQSRWLIAAYAVFHRGATLVPLDYKLGAAEQLSLLRHCGADVLVVEHGLLRRFDKVEGGTPELPLTLVSEAPEPTPANSRLTRWDDLPEASEVIPRVAQTRDDVATIVYSSGTGGRAKGCMLTHDAYLEQLRALMARFPMRPGHRTFSVLPTNHAIDFMVGFLGPFSCGATVVHQRSLRPEFLRSTMEAYEITHMALVPLLLSAFETSVEDRLADSSKLAKRAFKLLGGVNEMLTERSPNARLSRKLLGSVHRAFGGHLELLFCGGAFVDRDRAEYFYRLGLPVVIGYGLTEACTVATVNDLAPFRADSVGRPVDGVDVQIHNAGPDGVGEVWIRGRTLMKGYLDDPELTAETLTPDGWLRTGDLGWMDASHHLHLCGRSKNMIVTEGGKNVYPEDIEGAFEGLPVEELAVFASGYLWPRESELGAEQLVAVVRRKRAEASVSHDSVVAAVTRQNRRLPDFKRVKGLLFWEETFPRTASMKVKRQVLADTLRERATREALLAL